MSGWLSEPEVRRWWREDPAREAIETRYGPIVDGGDPTEIFVVEVDGVASGIIQRYRTADDPDWARALRTAVPATVRTPTAGIDYLLGRADVTTIAVSVQQANQASWRALEQAGYHRVWAGRLDTADPSDDGPAYVLVRDRAHPTPSRAADGLTASAT